MAFAGLKKQINKANQYVTEKMGGAEGTKLDVDFVEMERKADVIYELVEELQAKAKEFLQPNPTARAKMAAVKGISKMSGQAKAQTYPQPEGVLGDCLTLYGKKLGEDSIFAQSMVEMGESMKQMADAKYSLDDNIKQNFLEPLHHLQTKDLKEVMHHRKKLQGRRLDFDCKRRRQAKEDEIKQAEEKFAESLHLAQMGMFNLFENEVEQISQLCTFADALLEYHEQCVVILKSMTETLHEKREEAVNRPKPEFVPKTLADLHIEGISDGISSNTSPLASPMKNSPAKTPVVHQTQNKTPSCTALYDFEPENPGELGFKEGDNITLLSKIDENWFEGTVNGKTGYFPVSYVQVTVPLP
ncbi:endophilin A, putative [Pediculus humanus corporis]|uniref:Endophilin-A n=1 Tax=Pediculus humanus subsp. corporis TaxID=121224 RepID=E0VB09_PEDHC|nr:endophilin A, putative [Pediculus humanus corporis]EEB10565.1 endophilin A, putative [Pediculus humanus corporis]